MRKVFLLFAVLLTAVIIAGCGARNPEEKQGGAKETQAASETETAAQAQESPVSSEWFDDAVFVGDSVTLKLSYYAENNPDALGDAKFFCAGSLGFTSALFDLYDERAVHPYYEGQLELCENCAEVTGASKVLIMLGINDIALYGVEDSLESCRTLVDKIRTNSPDVTVYLQSVTPIIKGKKLGDLTNKLIAEFNKALKAYCDGEGIKYLDIYSVVADKDGCLVPDYCGDPDVQGIHFTSEACRLWVEYLKENV